MRSQAKLNTPSFLLVAPFSTDSIFIACDLNLDMRFVLILNYKRVRTAGLRVCTIPYLLVPHRTAPLSLYGTVPHLQSLYHTVGYHIAPHHTVPQMYRTVLHHNLPLRTIPYHSVNYRIIPYCTVTNSTIPYHAIPYFPNLASSHEMSDL